MQSAECRVQRAEGRRRAEGRGQRADGVQSAECRVQRAEGRRRAEGRGQRAEGRVMEAFRTLFEKHTERIVLCADDSLLI